MKNELSLSEAESMMEVYENYVKENLEDIYSLPYEDKGLLVKLAIEENLWNKSNPKTQKGFINRVKSLNQLLIDYNYFRKILSDGGRNPEYKNKVRVLLGRN